MTKQIAQVDATLVTTLRADFEKLFASINVPAEKEAVQVTAMHARRTDKAPEKAADATVERPKEGGVCAEVWNALDKIRAEAGIVPSLEEVRKLAKKQKWNANNARIEYYRWRAFNGIVGRGKKMTATVPAQPATTIVTATGYNGPDRRKH